MPETDIDKLRVQTCDEEVTRRGELEPCERTAVAVRIDPNEGKPYAVCAAHARGEMVPLAALVAELVGLRTEVDQLRTDNERLQRRTCCEACGLNIALTVGHGEGINHARREQMDTLRAERDAALARAVRAEQALLGVRKTLDALCEPTRLTHPTRLRSALDAFLAAVPLVGAEEPTGQATTETN